MTATEIIEILTTKAPKRLKVLRELHDYTQEYVADKVGLSQAAYGNLERGSSEISIKNLINVCKVYSITIDDFADFDLNKIVAKNNVNI